MKWFGLEGTNVVEKSLNIKQGFSLHLDQFLQHKNVLMGLGCGLQSLSMSSNTLYPKC